MGIILHAFTVYTTVLLCIQSFICLLLTQRDMHYPPEQVEVWLHIKNCMELYAHEGVQILHFLNRILPSGFQRKETENHVVSGDTQDTE